MIQKTPTSLDNFYVMCNSDQKLSQLVHFLRKNPDAKIIVFFITCACVDFFVKVCWPLAPLLVANECSRCIHVLSRGRCWRYVACPQPTALC